MERRSFMKMGLAAVPAMGSQGSAVAAATIPAVRSGSDRQEEKHTLGFSTIAFKVSTQDTAGRMFIMEHTNLAKGGPFRHMHPEQDEWLYAMEGDFRVEVGDQKSTLKPGDSILDASRRSACLGTGR